jgi:N utilization substance protein B
MQLLYTDSRNSELKFSHLLNLYKTSVEKSFELYLFNLLHLIRLAEYARHDASNKKAKLRPSEKDLAFQPKLGTNELITSLVKHKELERRLQKVHLDSKIERDNLRLIYADFAKTKEYETYLEQAASANEDHQNILLELFRFCIGNENFNELAEELYPSWLDDKTLVVAAIKKTIKSLPATDDFFAEYLPQQETSQYGEELLRTTYYEGKSLQEIIEPVLKNWDSDRVAIIDMILLKMALAELLYFPTIPAKVTLNEFVEVSKLYSTDKSKDFINGILDRLMKQLHENGKIKKEGRGLID